MFIKRSLFIVSMLLMASVAMAESLCIQDGYHLMLPKGKKCPGELVEIKKITKMDDVNKATCYLSVVDWKGKTYVKDWSCLAHGEGAETAPLKKSLEKQYLGLPSKIGDVVLESYWGTP